MYNAWVYLGGGWVEALDKKTIQH